MTSPGVIFQSSENGSDGDSIAFDNFTLTVATDITEVHWIGGYLWGTSYPFGPVSDFKIEFYSTVANQPNLGAGALKRYDYDTGIGNAGEYSIGNGFYAYSFALPTAFHTEANTKYWIKIVAMQPGNGGWGLAKSTSGDLTRYRGIVNCPQCSQYSFMTTGDVTFSLFAADLPISVPEFGLIAALLAFTGSAGSYIFAKKRKLS